MLGRKLGRDFLLHHGPRFHITPEIVARVEGIFDRHGGKAIILGRFIGVARAVTPFLAGSSHLPLRRFLAFDIAGAGAWAASLPGSRLPVAASCLRRGLALAHDRPRDRRRRRRRRRRARHPAGLPQRAAG